jgi:hypothetical protein
MTGALVTVYTRGKALLRALIVIRRPELLFDHMAAPVLEIMDDSLQLF